MSDIFTARTSDSVLEGRSSCGELVVDIHKPGWDDKYTLHLTRTELFALLACLERALNELTKGAK